ncbi:unnamed protein product [Clonostachys rosea]|uniref:Arrestin-like N-terminal domain-containing protein n=1 Tax=Bionectria ochroleuca TaxID=29856 RepID=A0ABY6UGJ4_BIOOC|nr:unnamed protein product [Clonostachys rosea]
MSFFLSIMILEKALFGWEVLLSFQEQLPQPLSVGPPCEVVLNLLVLDGRGDLVPECILEIPGYILLLRAIRTGKRGRATAVTRPISYVPPKRHQVLFPDVHPQLRDAVEGLPLHPLHLDHITAPPPLAQPPGASSHLPLRPHVYNFDVFP